MGGGRPGGEDSAVYYPGTGRRQFKGAVPPGAFNWFASTTAKYGGAPGMGGIGRMSRADIPKEWLGDPKYAGFMSWLQEVGAIPPEDGAPPPAEVTPLPGPGPAPGEPAPEPPPGEEPVPGEAPTPTPGPGEAPAPDIGAPSPGGGDYFDEGDVAGGGEVPAPFGEGGEPGGPGGPAGDFAPEGMNTGEAPSAGGSPGEESDEDEFNWGEFFTEE